MPLIQTVTNSICIFLGSRMPTDASIVNAITQVAKDLVTDGYKHLVFGGGNRGGMGILAQVFLSHGGQVTEVIPSPLYENHGPKGELSGTTRLFVPDMHERKKVMMKMSRAFLTLPGGIGTLDELTEAWSHRDFAEFCPNLPGAHTKPLFMTTDDEASALLVRYFQARQQQGLISAETMSHLHAAPWAECREHLRQLLASPLAA